MRNLKVDNNINEEEEKPLDIDKVIDDYYIANSLKKEQDNIVKANSVKIKQYLDSNNLTEFTGKNHTAKISVSESIDYNEVKLLQLVKELPEDYRNRLIDTIEIVNLDKLEKLLITGELKASQFSDAEEVKKTVKLYVK